MARCETCGNDYDKAFEISLQGQSHVFDSFECAIHALAPKCAHCGCKVIGHGVENNGTFYCCAHCATNPACARWQTGPITSQRNRSEAYSEEIK